MIQAGCRESDPPRVDAHEIARVDGVYGHVVPAAKLDVDPDAYDTHKWHQAPRKPLGAGDISGEGCVRYEGAWAQTRNNCLGIQEFWYAWTEEVREAVGKLQGGESVFCPGRLSLHFVMVSLRADCRPSLP